MLNFLSEVKIWTLPEENQGKRENPKSAMRPHNICFPFVFCIKYSLFTTLYENN